MGQLSKHRWVEMASQVELSGISDGKLHRNLTIDLRGASAWQKRLWKPLTT